MSGPSLKRTVDWVLKHSGSIWVGVIETRRAAGDPPEPKASIFASGPMWFAAVRWPPESEHQQLVLRLDRGPDGQGRGR